ncbi:HAD domain-containing protein [Streptomyces sp. NPDC052225]|uniref:HAD domain-containing protein n=1 Tax=Streptomyces sp. NPDC052225 TaxID=3154949 RepID=UPI0034486E0F
MTTARPLLFLDVDGPLIPFGPPPPGGHPTYEPDPDPSGHPLLSRANPALGPALAALPCDLVWATTWMDDANALVGPRLGLPVLPVLDEPEEEDPEVVRGVLHWKVRPVVARAAGRPFVWIDDEIGHGDRNWVAAHHPGRALLHRVDPGRGLAGADLRLVGEWLRGV